MSVFQTRPPLLVDQTDAPIADCAFDVNPWGVYVAAPLCCVPLVLIVLFWLKKVKANHAINWSVTACVLASGVMAVWWLADMRPKYDAEQACLDAAMGKQDVPPVGPMP